jgi:hypothetical protein
MDVVKKMESMGMDADPGTPSAKIVIADCGEVKDDAKAK